MTEPILPEPKNGAGPTEPDEEKILRELYGEPNAEGAYDGSPKDGE